MPKFWMLWPVVALAVALALLSAPPPAAVSATAPATAFSAARAMAVVRDIGRAPHPIGSAEHARVRDAVLARLAALGLEAWTNAGTAVRKTDDGYVGADVENIVAVLPGKDRTLPAVLLMAHYDSVAGSPAAADDSAGVASILETVRALKARGQPARDVVVLITDGEETGLFGAQSAFKDGLGQYDIKHIGLVINLEARGSSGPAFMFETGPANAGAMHLYAAAVARPEASSLSGFVYDHMPNGTDFTVPKTVGLTGFNIAMIGTPFDYHSPSAVPAALDPRSLQHMGDQTLALADALARARVAPPPGPDLVYSEVFGRWLVAYPAWAGWLLLGVAAILIVLTLRAQGLPQRRLELARGAGLFLLILLWPALITHLAFRLAPVGEDFYQSPTVAQFGLFFAGMALLAAGVGLGTFGTFLRGAKRWLAALLALGLGVVCSLVGGFDVVGAVIAGAAAVVSALALGPKPEPKAAGQGLLITGLVLAGVLQAVAPETAYVIAWPLLVAAIAAALLSMAKGPGLAWSLLAGLVAAVGLGWTLRMSGFLFDGLGLTNPELLGLFSALSALILAPFILAWAGWGKGGHWSAFAMNLSGIALLTYVALHSPWSARTPAPSHVLYVANQDTGQARVVSVRDKLDPWSRGVLESYGQLRDGPQPALFADHTWWAEAGRAAPLPQTRVPLLPGASGGDSQAIIVASDEAVRDYRINLTFSQPVEIVDIGGRRPEGATKPVTSLRVRWYGAAETGVILNVRYKSPTMVHVRWAALRDGWPARARPLPHRPADVMATGSSDATVVTGQTTLRW